METLQKVTVFKCKCNVCGHGWITKKAEKPVRCAKCTSPYWDRPKKKSA